MFQHKGVLYKVTGTTLYSVADDGTHASRGTVAGSDRCIFSGNGNEVVITANGVAYTYNVSTTTFTTVSATSMTLKI